MLSDVSRRGRPAGAPPRTEVIDATARGRPDLWASASASEAELSPGEAFELAATVGNRGGAGAPATTLRYHRSADARISTSDAELGTNTVGALAAGATSAESLTLRAPMAPGTYHYGACADAVPDESNANNNCSSAVEVTVAEPPRVPDLVVAAPAVDDSTPGAGAEITLSATVRNRGGATAPATTLRYYRSTDATISHSDASAGTDDVATLDPGDSGSESTTVSAPAAAGTYCYGACVDAVAGESDAANNCSSPVPVAVRESTTSARPDLVVVSPSASDAEPGAGEAFTLSVSVRNDGDAASASTTLRYYRSTDAAISGSDTPAGTARVAQLGAAGSSAESVSLTAPSAPGVYHYGACADAVSGESDTTNNCSPAVRVAVVEASRFPDLAVGAPSSGGSSVPPDRPMALWATVRNQGGGDADATTLRYYRSTDPAMSTSDTEVATRPVRALGADAPIHRNMIVIMPDDVGERYYYGACVDAVPDESDTTNNCSSSVRVTVAERPKPDLARKKASED